MIAPSVCYEGGERDMFAVRLLYRQKVAFAVFAENIAIGGTGQANYFTRLLTYKRSFDPSGLANDLGRSRSKPAIQ